MRRTGGPLWVALLLLAWTPRRAEGKTTCSSSMPGDFKSTACGAFCKLEKKANQ
jgi:hypothetical protein